MVFGSSGISCPSRLCLFSPLGTFSSYQFSLGIEGLLLVGLRFGLVFHYYSVSLLLVLLIIFSIILPSSFPFVLSFIFISFLVQHLQTAMLAVPLLPATLQTRSASLYYAH